MFFFLPKNSLIIPLVLILFDTRHLEGLWRVGSFLGLGLTLMGLGYVWQRWVFGKKAPDADKALEA